MLAVTIDKHLKFEEHIVEKAEQKLSALARVSNSPNQERLRTLNKAFLQFQFVCHSFLIWIFFGRNLNNRINHLHERSLKISYNDYESSSFQELLELDNSVSIHHRNIPLLANELFKVKNGLSNQIMSELFDLRIIECKLRSQTNFSLGAVYTTKYGLTTLRYFAPKIWNITPADIINVNIGLGLYMSIRIYNLIDVSDRQVFRFFF